MKPVPIHCCPQRSRPILPALVLLLTLLLASCTSNGQEQDEDIVGTGKEATPTQSTVEATGTTPARTPSPTPFPDNFFANPVMRTNFPDPAVLMVDDTFYAFATNGSGRNVQAARSLDLVDWEMLPDAMPALASWVRLSPADVWAPEPLRIGDQYLLYYTARDDESGRQCIGVAASQQPAGRYRDSRDEPLICQVEEGGSIDPSPFRDGEKLYLFWKNDGNCCGFSTYIYVQELAPDGLSLVGEPQRLLDNDATWEGGVIEAPTMVQHESSYFLFYSGNSYAGVDYAVGYATCETVTGPCQDAPENPILETALTTRPVIGPGHQDIVQLEDQTWILYHAWEVSNTGLKTDRRFVWLDPVVWEDGMPKVLGPTTDPQQKPEFQPEPQPASEDS